MTDKNDPMIQKIAETFSMVEEDGIPINRFMEWWKETEELAKMGLLRLEKYNFDDRQTKLQEVSQKLLDVHECGTSSLMYTYFIEFAEEWLKALMGDIDETFCE